MILIYPPVAKPCEPPAGLAKLSGALNQHKIRHEVLAGKFETRSFYEGDLSLYTDFLHPKGWDRKKVRQFIDNEFKKNKAVSEIMKKDPPIFTSNHAPLFAMRQG